MKKLTALLIFSLIALIGFAQPYIIGDESGNVTIGGNLTVTGNISFSPNHGSFGFQDSSVVISVTQNDFTHITSVTNTLMQTEDADGVTISNDTITLVLAGHYNIGVSLSFQGGTNDIWKLAIFINGSQIGFAMQRKTSNTDIGAMSTCVTYDAGVNDKVTFEITNSVDSDDPTVIALCCLIEFLHL